MSEVPVAVVWLVSAVLVEAACIDGRQLRVPNWLTYHFMVVGLAFWVYFGGVAGLLWSLEGLAVGLVALLPLYAIGGMGAGDVKLLAGVGAWIGTRAHPGGLRGHRPGGRRPRRGHDPGVGRPDPALGDVPGHRPRDPDDSRSRGAGGPCRRTEENHDAAPLRDPHRPRVDRLLRMDEAFLLNPRHRGGLARAGGAAACGGDLNGWKGSSAHERQIAGGSGSCGRPGPGGHVRDSPPDEQACRRRGRDPGGSRGHPGLQGRGDPQGRHGAGGPQGQARHSARCVLLVQGRGRAMGQDHHAGRGYDPGQEARAEGHASGAGRQHPAGHEGLRGGGQRAVGSLRFRPPRASRGHRAVRGERQGPAAAWSDHPPGRPGPRGGTGIHAPRREGCPDQDGHRRGLSRAGRCPRGGPGQRDAFAVASRGQRPYRRRTYHAESPRKMRRRRPPGSSSRKSWRK